MSEAQKKLDANIKENYFAKTGVTKPYTVFVLVAVVAIIGMYSFSKFKMELFPNMNLPYVVMMTSSTGDWVKGVYDNPATSANADTVVMSMARGYADGLEMYMSMLPGKKNTTTTVSLDAESKAVSITLAIELQDGYDPTASTVLVSNYVNQLHAYFTKSLTDAQAAFTADPGIVTTKPEIAALLMFDGKLPFAEYPTVLALDPSLMPVYSFASTKVGGTGQIPASLLKERIEGTAGVARATATETTASTFTLINGQPAYSLRINKESTASTVEVVEAVKATLSKIQDEYAGFTYVEVLNQGEYIEESVNDVMFNLLLGGFLAILILFVFMRNWKITLAVAIAIPFSIIGSFVFMYFMGIGLNVISMSGLALVVGLLIDNSIVVSENIYRLRQKGLPIKDACIKGASQILMAIIAATLTTMCVFFPMFFVEGLIMQILLDLIWVVILSIFASLIVAVAVLPAIISTLRLGEESRIKWRWWVAIGAFFGAINAWFTRIFERPGNAVKKGYNKSVVACVRFKWIALCTAFLLFAGSIGLIFINGFELMPATDSGEVSMTLDLNDKLADYSVLASGETTMTRAVVETLATKLQTDVFEGNPKLKDIVQTTSIQYGSGGGTLGALGGGAGKSLSIDLVLKGKRDVSTAKASNIAYNAVQDYLLNYVGGQLFTKDVLHADEYLVTNIGASASGAMGGMVASDVSVTLSTPNLGASDNPALRLDTAMQWVAGQLRTALVTNNAQSGVLKVEADDNSTRVVTNNRRITQSVTIFVKESANINKVQELVNAEMDKIYKAERKEGGRLENITDVGGGFEQQMTETFTSIIFALIIGLLLMYLVMVAIFQSFKQPFIIIITVPLAFTGAFALLAACQMPLSVPAMIGLILLMGVVINNGIIMVDYFNRAREDGLTIREAAVSGASVRARPILMTAITTVVAMFPSAMGWGASGAMMQPLAIVTIGGLFYAMVTSLLVIPAFYCIAHFKQYRKENKEEKKNEQDNSSKLEDEQDPATSPRVLPRVRGAKTKSID